MKPQRDVAQGMWKPLWTSSDDISPSSKGWIFSSRTIPSRTSSLPVEYDKDTFVVSTESYASGDRVDRRVDGENSSEYVQLLTEPGPPLVPVFERIPVSLIHIDQSPEPVFLHQQRF